MRTYISSILSIIILAASLMPALHAFDHGKFSDGDSALSQKFSKATVDCELCDFRIVHADAPSVFIYEVFSPQRETIYNISLAETINLFSTPFFSLRAPPVMIG